MIVQTIFLICMVFSCFLFLSLPFQEPIEKLLTFLGGKSMGFFKELFCVKAVKWRNGLLRIIGLSNPMDLMRAQVKQYMSDLDTLIKKKTDAVTKHDKFEKTYLQIEKEYHVLTVAGDTTKDKYLQAENEEDKNKYYKNLEAIVERAELTRLDMNARKESLDILKEHMTILDTAISELHKKISTIQNQMETIQIRVEAATFKKEIAQDREHDAKLAMGILKDINPVVDATEIMEGVVTDLENETKVLTTKIDIIKNINNVEVDDDINKIIKDVKKDMGEEPIDLMQRLEALKK